MADQAPYKRRQYLVDYSYQLRFASHLFLVVFAIAVTGTLVASALIKANMYRPELGDQSYAIVALIAVATTLVVQLLLAIPLVLFLGIRQSHRIIGPMKRIIRTLEAIGQGNFSQHISLRQGDALEELAKSINQMSENLQKRGNQSPH